MESFARWIHRHALGVLIAAAALSAVAGLKLPLAYDDDVVRFLPSTDPAVEAFERISAQFGSLNVAFVGVEGDDLFTARRLGYVRELSRHLDALPIVDFVTSVTELSVIKGKREADHIALVPPKVPSDPAALAGLRETILGLDYLVGSLVSADAQATLLVCQLRTEIPPGTRVSERFIEEYGLRAGDKLSSKRAAEIVKAEAEALQLPEHTALHFGGAPFIAEAAANGSQADLIRLAPFVVGIILLLIVLSLGSFQAALLTVLAVGLGILWTMGLMGWLGVPLTLVSTSLPVLLVALGSAYAVHLLVWYREHDADPIGALTNMGWPIVVTALTTAAGFLSFLVMDLGPMREFGWQMAAGALICALIAITVVPAALRYLPLAPRPADVTRLDRWLVGLARRCQARRWPILAVALALATVFAFQLPYIDTRMDTSAFFEEDSAPAKTDRLLADKFGGSVFLAIFVEADLRDPAVLHRVAAFEDRLAGVDGVTRVESITKVLSIVHEGLKGARRVSRSRDEIAQLGYLAYETDKAVSLLVDKAWGAALIQVGIGGFDTGVVERIAGDIRKLADEHLGRGAVRVTRAAEGLAAVARDAAERIGQLAGLDDAQVDRVARLLAAPPSDETRASVAKAVADVINVEIGEDEMVELKDDDQLAPLTAAVVERATALTLDKPAFKALLTPHAAPSELGNSEGFDKGSRYVFTKIEQRVAPTLMAGIWAELAPIVGALPVGRRTRVEAIVDEVLQPAWYVPHPAASGATRVTVSGQPVLQEAMTRSVRRNQSLSLLISLPLVFLIMALVFRSVLAGILGTIPAGFTLLLTFGIMGLFPEDVPMDIAASMLASIALGVGIDYAIHFMWRYRQGGVETAMRTTGRAIVINAAEITGGFIVLAWASIAPMSRFGLLLAETLMVAAVATLVLLPALLVWWTPAGQRASPEVQGETA